MNIKILLSGDGGQGIQLIANMICRAAFNNALHVTSIPNYGLEQRGGVSLNFIQISDKKIMYPKFTKPDILLIMSPQARERVEGFKIEYLRLKIDLENHFDFLKKNNVPVQSYNIFCLRLIIKILEEKNILKSQDVFGLLEKKLSEKHGWEENKKAFDLGYR